MKAGSVQRFWKGVLLNNQIYSLKNPSTFSRLYSKLPGWKLLHSIPSESSHLFDPHEFDHCIRIIGSSVRMLCGLKPLGSQTARVPLNEIKLDIVLWIFFKCAVLCEIWTYWAKQCEVLELLATSFSEVKHGSAPSSLDLFDLRWSEIQATNFLKRRRIFCLSASGLKSSTSHASKSSKSMTSTSATGATRAHAHTNKALKNVERWKTHLKMSIRFNVNMILRM